VDLASQLSLYLDVDPVDQASVSAMSDVPAPATPPDALPDKGKGAGKALAVPDFTSRPPPLGKGRDRDVFTDPYRQGPGQWLPAEAVKGGYWSIDERAVRAAGWIRIAAWSPQLDWDSRRFDPVEALQRGWIPLGADMSTPSFSVRSGSVLAVRATPAVLLETGVPKGQVDPPAKAPVEHQLLGIAMVGLPELSNVRLVDTSCYRYRARPGKGQRIAKMNATAHMDLRPRPARAPPSSRSARAVSGS
jgi:hypothetical protein